MSSVPERPERPELPPFPPSFLPQKLPADDVPVMSADTSISVCDMKDEEKRKIARQCSDIPAEVWAELGKEEGIASMAGYGLLGAGAAALLLAPDATMVTKVVAGGILAYLTYQGGKSALINIKESASAWKEFQDMTSCAKARTMRDLRKAGAKYSEAVSRALIGVTSAALMAAGLRGLARAKAGIVARARGVAAEGPKLLPGPEPPPGPGILEYIVRRNPTTGELEAVPVEEAGPTETLPVPVEPQPTAPVPTGPSAPPALPPAPPALPPAHGPVSPVIEGAELAGKTRSEIRNLAREKGLRPAGDTAHPEYPRKWKDPVTGQERLRLDRGHIDSNTGQPYNDPKAAGDHVHAYDQSGNPITVDGNKHVPTTGE